VVALLFTALALAAPGGLHGTVLRGPIRPVCQVGVPCTAPTRATLAFTREGVRRTVRSGTDGRYRIALPSGRYAVSVVPPLRIGRGIDPRAVTVPAGRFARVDFTIDTGIR
jgi:hypothetical protein